MTHSVAAPLTCRRKSGLHMGTHHTLISPRRGFQYKTYVIMNEAGVGSGENCLTLQHVRTLEPPVGLSAQ